VQDLRDGSHVDSSFVCVGKQTRVSRDGETNYVRLTLRDASGEMSAVLWPGVEDDGQFEDGDVVAVLGVCASSPIYGLQIRGDSPTRRAAGAYASAALGLSPNA
jgi:hypothetical protein